MSHASRGKKKLAVFGISPPGEETSFTLQWQLCDTLLTIPWGTVSYSRLACQSWSRVAPARMVEQVGKSGQLTVRGRYIPSGPRCVLPRRTMADFAAREWIQLGSRGVTILASCSASLSDGTASRAFSDNVRPDQLPDINPPIRPPRYPNTGRAVGCARTPGTPSLGA